MQLVVRTAQSKHKINLLALSTEDGGPYVVATWYVVLIVCSSCVPLNSNTNTSSHSPRRTGGPQAPASGALVLTNSAIDAYTKRAYYSLEDKQCFNIVIDKEIYIYILQQVRRDILL